MSKGRSKDLSSKSINMSYRTALDSEIRDKAIILVN